jgi:hypothetical protein
MSAGASVRPAPAVPAVGMRLRIAVLIEAVAVIGVLTLAVWLRLTGLGDPTDLSDEGIRGIQLRLLAAGYKPVSEIYASQGPLSLWLFYPAVLLAGPDILVARLTVVANSLVVLLGSAWIARAWAGRVAGIATALILAVSPVFLDNSRLAFVEVPSIAPTVLALVALLQFRRSGRSGWLIGSAALLAIGTLAKPMAAVAGLPALVLLVAPGGSGVDGTDEVDRSWRARLVDLAIFATTGTVICTVVVLAVGPATIYEQVVAYRLGARAVRGWDLTTNARLILDQVRRNGWGVVLAAMVGLVSVALDRRPLGLAVAGWLIGALVALLLYSPLWEKHVTYLLPPLAILAGVGLSALVPLAARRWGVRALMLGSAAVVALALMVLSADRLATDDRAVMYRHAGDDYARYADDRLIVEAATRPDDFVVIDDAYLGMQTGRLTPPFLADLSWNRILARALTADQAIAETRRFDSRILVLQDDHLGQVQRYLTWADREYLLVKSYVQRRPARFRRVYAAPGVDLGPVRASLRASLAQPTDVTIGPAALLGYEVERREIKAGSRLDLTLMFEALQSRPPEHALITRLRDDSGDVVWEGEWKVGDGTQELHTWQAGRWQAQTMRLLVDDVGPGSYTLTIALQRPNGNPAQIVARTGATVWRTGDELDLGQITVIR